MPNQYIVTQATLIKIKYIFFNIAFSVELKLKIF